VGEKWFGSEVNWKRSGSGSYRETSPVDLPQSRQEIEKFAKENGFSIEWRRPLPDETSAVAKPSQGARTA
jgi:hypothetical protein